MDADRRTRLVPGILLVILGVLFLLLQFLQFAAWLAIGGLGVAFLLSYYLWVRHLGLLIPGLILFGIGAFVGLQQATLIPQNFESSFLLFIGIAFLLVYALHTRREEQWGPRNWPLFPGLILSGLSLFFLVIQNELLLSGEQWAMVLQFWPLILIAIGVWILIRRRE